MNLRKARERVGLSQVKVAKIIGVTGGAVSQWESGLTHPKVRDLAKLAAIYGVSVDELLMED